MDGTRTFAQDGGLFGFLADHETGHVQEKHDRNMKAVAQLDEVRLLARGFDVDAAADHRIVADDADRVTVQTRQRGDGRASVGALDFEHRVAVDNHFDDPLHAVGLARVARHDADQFFFATVGRVIGGHHRRHLPDVGGHVRQKAPDQLETFHFAGRDVVDGAGLVDRDLRAAEFGLGEFLAESAFNNRRARSKDGAVLDHHRPVRHHRALRRAAGGNAEHRAHHRHHTQQFRDIDAGVVGVTGEHGEAALGGSDATAIAVNQPDQRDAVVVSKVIDETALPALAPSVAPAGAAANSGVLAANGHRPAIDFGNAHDIGRGRDLDDAPLLVVLALAGEFADLLETVRVGDAGDALAHGKESFFVAQAYGLFATHRFGPVVALADFFSLALPAFGLFRLI